MSNIDELDYLPKDQITLLAKALLGSTGLAFDTETFDDCEFITPELQDKIIKEIHKRSNRFLNEVSKKVGEQILPTSTREIVEIMFYE